MDEFNVEELYGLSDRQIYLKLEAWNKARKEREKKELAEKQNREGGMTCNCGGLELTCHGAEAEVTCGYSDSIDLVFDKRISYIDFNGIEVIVNEP